MKYIDKTARYTAKDMLTFKKLENMTLSEYDEYICAKVDIQDPLLYQHVLASCSWATGVDPMKVISRNRERDAVFARYMTMYFMKRLSEQKYLDEVYTLDQLGEMAGGKDHATVIWGIKTVEDVIFVNSPSDKRTHWLLAAKKRIERQLSTEELPVSIKL